MRRGGFAAKASVLFSCVALVLFIISCGGPDSSGSGSSESTGPSDFSKLIESCKQAREEDREVGFVVDREVAFSGEGRIPVSCIVEVKSGGSLTLVDAQLETAGLLILDSRPNGESAVRIEDSVLTASEDKGYTSFSIWLKDPEDRITIRNSTIDFPSGVSVSTMNPPTFGGGDLEVRDSTLRSVGQSGATILLSAGGERIFVGMKLEASKPMFPELVPIQIVALEKCRLERAEGVPQGVMLEEACASSDEAT